MWYCKAVTILQEDADEYRFVGKITLPPVGKAASRWWQRIDGVEVNDENKDLTIKGITNKVKGDPDDPIINGKPQRPITEHTYNNPGDYLLLIAAAWRDATTHAGLDFSKRGVFKRYEDQFKPRVLRCNEEMYPRNKVEYKKAYGLCIGDHCHKDSKQDDLCVECSRQRRSTTEEIHDRGDPLQEEEVDLLSQEMAAGAQLN